MDRITVAEASKYKSCTGQAIRDAIAKGVLDADVFGKTYVVKCNKKWEDWMPNPKRQAAGGIRQKKIKKAKKGKRG